MGGNMDIKNMIIEQHYKRQRNHLLRRATRKFQGDRTLAEDAVQEAYAKAIKGWSTFDMEKSNFNHWMIKILGNTINDMKSIEALHGGNKRLEEAENISAPTDTNRNLNNNELLRKIEEDIKEVRSPLKRQVLYLSFIKGLYPVDICKTVPRMSPDNAAKIVSRYRSELHEKYGSVA